MKKTTCLILLSLTCAHFVHAQKYQYKTWNLLDSNHGNDIGFKSIMGAASKARVFFLGENHSQNTFNTRMEYTMMRALYENCGYKNLIIELSPTTAYYMQRYICDDDSNARKVLNLNSAYYYMTYFDYLHKWQQGLLKEKRINIYGIDIERFFELPKHRLAEIFEKHRNNIPPKLIFSVLTYLKKDHEFTNPDEFSESNEMECKGGKKSNFKSKGFNKNFTGNSNCGFNEVNFDKFHDEILDSLYKYRGLMASWLGETDFSIANDLFNTISDCVTWESLERTPQQYLWREERMYQNLKSLLQNNPKEKYFGQFGRCHTAYNPREGDCGWYNYSSTAKKLTQGYFNKDESKVLTIGIFYRGFENNNTYNDADSDEDEELLSKEVKRLMSTSEKHVIVADLKDSLQGFFQLSKKFHYAFVSSKSYTELVALDSTAKKRSEIFQQDILDEKDDNPTNYEFGFLGLGYNMVLGSGLTHQLNLGSHFKNLNGLTYQCHLSATKNYFSNGLDFSYQFDKNLCSDNSGNYYYSNLNLTYSLGLNLKISDFKIKILGEMGWLKQMLDYESANVNLINPSNVLNRSVVNHCVTGGAQLRVDYNLNKNSAIGLKVRYGLALNPEIWTYANSNFEYVNLGKGLSYLSMGLMYTLNLYN